MKKVIFTVTSILCAMAANAADEVPAFPGAEGHGRYVTGGRGGEIIHVTNLNDSGPGSLREALKSTKPKTIVFDVSGYIDLRSQLNVSSNTTIAGQTAPEGGITLRYYTLYFGNCDNVIVRFIRSRRSQVKDVNDGADATWGRNRKGIILDHCSFSWSIDEVASFYDNRDFTMQWCNVTEGLANPGHSRAHTATVESGAAKMPLSTTISSHMFRTALQDLMAHAMPGMAMTRHFIVRLSMRRGSISEIV